MDEGKGQRPGKKNKIELPTDPEKRGYRGGMRSSLIWVVLFFITLIAVSYLWNREPEAPEIDFRVFKNISPEISLYTIARYYPSLTEAGRHRLEYDLDFNVEVINNLYVGGTFYFSYDSRTGDGALSNGDLGFTTKLSYKFGL